MSAILTQYLASWQVPRIKSKESINCFGRRLCGALFQAHLEWHKYTRALGPITAVEAKLGADGAALLFGTLQIALDFGALIKLCAVLIRVAARIGIAGAAADD